MTTNSTDDSTDGREPGSFQEQAGSRVQVSAKPSVLLPGSGLNYFLLKVEEKDISPAGPRLLILEDYRSHLMELIIKR